VDRIVLNAYFPLGQRAGGFRTWWRLWNGGDESLDDTHLMRIAGRFSRRVRAFAKARGIPVVFCPAGTRKHELAREYLAQHPKVRGVFMILIARAPAPVWEVERSAAGKIQDIARPKSLPYVNHLYFHILDPEWGHLTIKMGVHPPFNAQILLNGHEYVACHARKKAMALTQVDNCFTQASNLAGLARVAETLSESRTIGRLNQVCDRWIYTSCLCFVLNSEEQEKANFRYQYSVYQAEYSRNLLWDTCSGWTLTSGLGSKLARCFNVCARSTHHGDCCPRLSEFSGQERVSAGEGCSLPGFLFSQAALGSISR
jgi:hypothetical protein